MTRPTLLLALLATALGAQASDGTIEINHARALAGGVTAGDTPGYPVTLSQPGSYRLTGNLTQPNPNTDVIRIHASHVTLDLNGHAILGANTCALSGGAVVCTANGTGRGISTTSSPVPVLDLWIRNGRLAGIASDCITGSWGLPSKIEDISVSECGGYGIQGSNAEVNRSQATLCGSDGIRSWAAIGNEVVYNGGVGLAAESLAKDNVAVSNVGIGIQMTFSGTAIGNVIRLNGGVGIASGNAFAASANMLRGNSSDVLPVSAISVPPSSNLCSNVPC